MPIRATVMLTSRIGPTGERELPLDPPWAQVADEAGLAVLPVPAGVYRIRMDYSGTGRNEGIIRVREMKGDSIHANLIAGALCNES